MKRLLIIGIESEIGRHLVRHMAHQTCVLGVPFSAVSSHPACGIRRLPHTTPDAVRRLLEADAITHVIFCGQASCSGWSSAPLETRPCSDTSQLRAWSAACAGADLPFAFISSDAQFESPWIFHEEDSESLAETPLAQSIRHQETIVSERAEALIVRTHVCGFSPESMLTRLLLHDANTPPARRRWYATPIYAGRFAHLLSRLIDQQAAGIYHLGGGERISHSQFVSRLAERFHTAKVPLHTVGRHAPEDTVHAPRETSLRSSKARRLLNAGLPGISDFLEDAAADLESGLAHELAEPVAAPPHKVA